MANEVTVPLLPCASIDEIVSFYETLGFTRTYRQTKPDTGVVHTAFAAGLRERYGKVPMAGIPRMTRPRRRKNSGNLAGFTVVDPGGNHLRIFPAGDAAPVAEQGKLGVALDNAVVQGDSRGYPAQAAKVLDGALARVTDATAVERVEALAYRAELAMRLDDRAGLTRMLAELRAVELSPAERDQVAAALAAAAELG